MSKSNSPYLAPAELMSRITEHLPLRPAALIVEGEMRLGLIHLISVNASTRGLFITADKNILKFDAIFDLDLDADEPDGHCTLSVREWQVQRHTAFNGQNLVDVLHILEFCALSLQEVKTGSAATYINSFKYLCPVAKLIYSFLPSVPSTKVEIEVYGFEDHDSLVSHINSLTKKASKAPKENKDKVKEPKAKKEKKIKDPEKEFAKEAKRQRKLAKSGEAYSKGC
ncbi:MAG: hypothetical protein ACRC6V_04000 [Bacteroidales bacterium]